MNVFFNMVADFVKILEQMMNPRQAVTSFVSAATGLGAVVVALLYIYGLPDTAIRAKQLLTVLIAYGILQILLATAFFVTCMQTSIAVSKGVKWFLVLFSLLASGGLAFLISYYFYGFAPTSSSLTSRENSANGSPAKLLRDRKVSTILENDEEMLSGSGRSERPDMLEMRRMRKRDWAKKIYKSFVQPGSLSRRTPSDESDSPDGLAGRGRYTLKRRHSSAAGPFQIARDLIRRSSRHYFRQSSEMLRDRLPRPPQEFFEPSDLPEIPQNLQPEIFYILHNLKMLELPGEWKLDPRDIEVRSFMRDEYIVRPGEPDDSIYVAVEGTLAVYITHMEGKEYLVKRIPTGNSFFSLLSMLDILM
uniref:Cyclic nucleotide-binding domain-containing protein n=1 Tax=Heterorhabditis bacteriophora TaxID=37862 RepID=A0A1I7XTK1_HETBA